MKKRAPKYCYHRKGRWVYVPYVDGKLGKEIPLKHKGKLIRLDDPMSIVWAAVENIQDQPSDCISWLIDQYLKSDKFEQLKPRTKRDYKQSASFLKSKPTKKGLFGEVAFEAVTPGVITKLIDSMSDKPTSCKHRIQFLSAVYSWAFARDKCSKNPCKGADKAIKKSKPKTYVEDSDYYFALDNARKRKTYLYPMMILAYCCRARVGEISRRERVEGHIAETGIRQSDISDEGIHIHRSKGSLPEVTLWSDFLKEGYQAAICFSKEQDKRSRISRLTKNQFLLRDLEGSAIGISAFNSAWSRMMKACKKENSNFKPFTIHELKAKGIDDHKYQASGHKSEKAKSVYLRKTKRTESTK